MAASLRSKFEEHLTCSVCLEQLKDPRVLPCLHSFCHECIVNLARKANSKNIHCPECRKVAQVDNPDNPSNLPSNFFVNNLLATMALTDEKKEQKIPCENCTDDNCAATRCEECAMFLCSYCSEFHKKSRPTKHHVLTTLQELKSGASPLSVAEKIRCGKHKEEFIKLYCKTCQSTICRDCTIVEHRSHDYGFIEDVAADEKETLIRNMNEVQQRQATLQRGIASLKLFDQSLVDESALVVAQITSHFEELQKAETAKKNELLSKANSLTSLKRKQINAQIEALEVALASCRSSVEFTEKAFKNGNDVQVLSMQKYILQSLQELKKVKDVTQPCCTRNMRFIIPWSIADTEKSFLSYFGVDEYVASDPDQCKAEFTDQGEKLKRGKPTSVKISCFDRNKKRVKNGGQVVRANISGVEFDEVRTNDNKDGTHTVAFTPHRGGTLKFEATIDGRPAPGCTLTKDVRWVFSNDYGNGQLSEGGLKLNSYSDRKECWRIGECSFSSGVHTWKVRVNTEERRNLNNATGFGYAGYREKKKRPVTVTSHSGNWRYSYAFCVVGVTATLHCEDEHGYEIKCQNDEEVSITVRLNIPNHSLHFAIERSNQATIEEEINIYGEQFWPYVLCSGNMEVTLNYD